MIPVVLNPAFPLEELLPCYTLKSTGLSLISKNGEATVMKNIDLNAGGVIGALLAGALVGVIAFSTMEDSDNQRGASKLLIAGVIGGAFAGKYLWGLAFKTKE